MYLARSVPKLLVSLRRDLLVKMRFHSRITRQIADPRFTAPKEPLQAALEQNRKDMVCLKVKIAVLEDSQESELEGVAS